MGCTTSIDEIGEIIESVTSERIRRYRRRNGCRGKVEDTVMESYLETAGITIKRCVNWGAERWRQPETITI